MADPKKNSDRFDRFAHRCTPRQKEVTELLLKGKTLAQIARKLHLSRSRVSQIRNTLRVRAEDARARSRRAALRPD